MNPGFTLPSTQWTEEERLLLANELAVSRRELAASTRELERLKAAVRDKAQEVYDSAESICLDGTNEWLRSLGLGELRVTTCYKFKVPVKLEIVIKAENEDQAREILGSHYDDREDSDAVDSWEIDRTDPSWDWFKKIPLAESWALDRDDN